MRSGGKSDLEEAGWVGGGRPYPGASVLNKARYERRLLVFLLGCNRKREREGDREEKRGGRRPPVTRSRVRRRSRLTWFVPKVVRDAAGSVDRRRPDEGGTREAERGGGARCDVRREGAQDGTFEDGRADGLSQKIVFSSSPRLTQCVEWRCSPWRDSHRPRSRGTHPGRPSEPKPSAQ